MMSTQEKASFGILGSPPVEIASCKRDTVKAWKALAAEAKRVARMPVGPAKAHEVRVIAARRKQLVAQIINEAQNEHG